MSRPVNLAVCAPQIGAVSETFVKRHMEDLLPGRTVVVVDTDAKPYAGHWTVECPLLVRNRIRRPPMGVKERLAFALHGQVPVRDWKKQAVVEFLRRQKVGMMLGEYLSYSFHYFQIARELGIPYYAHSHGNDTSHDIEMPEWREKYALYANAAGVIAVNQVGKARLEAMGIEPAKIKVIPCGVDVPRALPPKKASAGIRCLAVGRFVEMKAPILLLDAFRRAALECDALHLDYIGDGPLLPAARHYVKALELGGRVTLHGACSHAEVKRYLLNADIFLQHSVTECGTGCEEGLPVAILEAMAYGLPVISTRHAGIPDAVLEGETGLLVDEGDSLAMSEALLSLSYDKSRRVLFGTQGWQRARTRFSWEQTRRELLDFMGLGG